MITHCYFNMNKVTQDLENIDYSFQIIIIIIEATFEWTNDYSTQLSTFLQLFFSFLR